MSAVQTAGTLPWRCRGGRLQVALVHRRRYDDWSWPKGELDGTEPWAAAARRETLEETGLPVRLGIPLPGSDYRAPGVAHGRRKVVRYWAATPVGGAARLHHEVDRVRWVSVKKAKGLLTYDRDLAQLAALVAAAEAGSLETWPLAIVRHAHALPRKQWRHADWRRPLDAKGAGQVDDIAAVLSSYDIRTVVSSSATRCVHTVAPYAKAAGVRIHSTSWLSEEGFEDKPERALAIMRDLLRSRRPASVCSHGPVLPGLVGVLLDRTPSGPARRTLKDAAGDKLVKGEVLIAHVRGHGSKARVVAVERHQP